MRNIDKYINEASDYLKNHGKHDLNVEEMREIYEKTQKENNGDIACLISNAFLFGYSAGNRRAANS